MSELPSKEQRLAICKPAPNGGFLVMNEHLNWTPVLDFAASFEPEHALRVVRLSTRGWFTKPIGELRNG
jgi:hypothetical protein